MYEAQIISRLTEASRLIHEARQLHRDSGGSEAFLDLAQQAIAHDVRSCGEFDLARKLLSAQV